MGLWHLLLPREDSLLRKYLLLLLLENLMLLWKHLLLL